MGRSSRGGACEDQEAEWTRFYVRACGPGSGLCGRLRQRCTGSVTDGDIPSGTDRGHYNRSRSANRDTRILAISRCDSRPGAYGSTGQ